MTATQTASTTSVIDVDTVDLAPAAQPTAPSTSTLPATDRQISFAADLGKQMATMVELWDDEEGNRALHLNFLRDCWSMGLHDRKLMSRMIDSMLNSIRRWKREDRLRKPAAPAPSSTDPSSTSEQDDPALLEGMHRTADGTIYKVQRAVHGSGQPYAKKLTRHAECEGHETTSGAVGSLDYCDGTCVPADSDEVTWSFVYAPGAINELSEGTRLSIEEAKEWGVLYGTCCVCAATLTDEKSIERGIGPICGKKFA